jgi:hypothetical protein
MSEVRNTLNPERLEWSSNLPSAVTELWPTSDSKPLEIAHPGIQAPAQPQKQHATSRQKRHRLLHPIISVMLALACLEFCLRLVSTGLPNLPQPAEFMPSRGSCSPVITLRQYYEGFSVAHYCSDGGRVTSQLSLRDGPFGVLLGDSFVQAAQVGDDAAAGSLIESIARSEGTAINVRQYGWGGAGVPVYLAVADRINRVLDPLWIAVVLDKHALGAQGLEESSYWRGRVNSDLSLAISQATESGSSSFRFFAAPSHVFTGLLKRSSLLVSCVYKLRFALHNRAADVVTTSITPADEQANQAIVHSLSRAYGDRLILVYVPQVGIDREEPPMYEESLSSACRRESVRFVSLKSDMMRARDSDHQLCAGFGNSTPGEGHLNAYGHAVLAKAILRTVREAAIH